VGVFDPLRALLSVQLRTAFTAHTSGAIQRERSLIGHAIFKRLTLR